ncbi:betaine aldehyde dehydrogenase [Schistosoma japonicum]|nr:betaine aldehyde dehydrogenase [Schistosoma japonicum]
MENVLPYVNGIFIEPGDGESVEKTQIGSLDFSVFSCQSVNSEAIKLAESFEYDSKSLESFLQRLLSSLESHMPLLLECISAALEFESRGFFTEVIQEVIKKMKCVVQFPLIDSDYFYNPIHEIEEDDCDFIFHFTFILRYLCYPVFRGKSHGLVVTCKSLRLMVFFSTLTRIIHESIPLRQLFSFLPIFCKNTENFCRSRSIAVIYQSSDIDSAARYCVSSLQSAMGTGIGHSSLILVEESVYKRFVDRMEYVMTLNAAPNIESENFGISNYPSFCSKDLHEVISYADSVGAKILCRNKKISHSPVIVHDITPSSVRITKTSGPVAFVLSFRTVKESASLLMYFIDHFNNPRLNRINRMSYEITLNIWQTDSNIIWQLFQMLLLSGVDNIFVNTSNRQLAATMYTRLFEVNGLPCFPSEVSKINSEGTLYKALSTIISTARAAQANSVSKGYELVHCELLKGEVLPGIPLEKDAFKYFMHNSCRVLGGQGKFFLIGKRQDTLLVPVAHQCLKPTGPIVLVVNCKLLSNSENCTLILRLVLCTLFTGNSVVLLMTNNDLMNEDNNFLNNINTIQKRLNISSLITVHMCASCSMIELDCILSNLCAPSTVVNLDNVDISSKDLSHHISDLVCLSRPVTLYWSTGCNLFH